MINEKDSRIMPEGYQQVEQDFLADIQETHENETVLELFNELREVIRTASIRDGIDSEEFRKRLNQSEYVVSQLYHALNAYAKHDKETFFSIPYNIDLNLRKSEWDDITPIDKTSLENVASEYLKRPWMQLGRIDWYLLNGFIFDEFARFRNEAVSGQLLAQYGDFYFNFVRPFIAAKNDSDLLFKQTIYRLIWAIGVNCLRWVIFPLLIYFLYSFEYEKAATWIGIPYVIYIAYFILTFPFRFWRKRVLNKKIKEITELDEKLARLYTACRGKTINPTLLKEMIRDAERNKIVIRSVVHSVLDRAIQRDPAVLSF